MSVASGVLREDAFAARHLGRAVYRLIDPGRVAEAIAQLEGASRPLLVEAKVPVDDVCAVGELTAAGFRIVDTAVQLDVTPDALHAADVPGVSIRDARPDDRGEVERLSAENMVTSRFHLDPAIEPDRASDLKRAWAGNFFDGRRGQRLLVGESASGVGAFLLVLERETEGTIDLVAVAPEQRGRGVLGALLRGWIDRAPALKRLVVGTQISNVRSLRAYDKVGFRIAGASYVLHYHA